MKMDDILKNAVAMGASDIHITVGSPVIYRLDGVLKPIDDRKLMPQDAEDIVLSMMNQQQKEKFAENGEVDFSYALSHVGRFRVNAFMQRGTMGMAVRVVVLDIPKISALGLPPVVRELTEKKSGLILVTGPTGSGKSTTLASMIDVINGSRNDHIITIEDPIEYLHKHNQCIVNQREIGADSKSFGNALRAALRQDPDIILVGEMRDADTMQTAITAAETGHLVMSTLHTKSAVETIERIIDVFPPHQQNQVRIQLASILEAVISQRLLPRADGSGRVVAYEILIANRAARNLIRTGKTHQLQTVLETGSQFGMVTMANSLLRLHKEGKINRKIMTSYLPDDIIAKLRMERY
ncbi:MAG: type IV pili twitching motility protein PilT [Clostridiales bacterium]|nr:MAG: type IV pili twitching motility protein PilT [Clostridiales bacterium]